MVIVIKTFCQDRGFIQEMFTTLTRAAISACKDPDLRESLLSVAPLKHWSRGFGLSGCFSEELACRTSPHSTSVATFL